MIRIFYIKNIFTNLVIIKFRIYLNNKITNIGAKYLSLYLSKLIKLNNL